MPLFGDVGCDRMTGAATEIEDRAAGLKRFEQESEVLDFLRLKTRARAREKTTRLRRMGHETARTSRSGTPHPTRKQSETVGHHDYQNGNVSEPAVADTELEGRGP